MRLEKWSRAGFQEVGSPEPWLKGNLPESAYHPSLN